MDSVDQEPEAEQPCLEQRFAPWLGLRTTIHPQGLVIQVARPLRHRQVAVGFDRLVLEPATISSLRPALLWSAAITLGLAVPSALPQLSVWLPPLLAPTLFGVSILLLVVAVIHPRRMTLFLDRESVIHPTFLRGGGDDETVSRFVDAVRQAAVAWHCNPPEQPTEEDGEPQGPSLADRLDMLSCMHAEGLLNKAELAHFSELASRR